MGKKQVKVTMTEEQYERFRSVADENNRSLSEFINESCEQYIKRYVLKKSDTIEKRIASLRKELEHLYGIVHTRAVSGKMVSEADLDDQGPQNRDMAEG